VLKAKAAGAVATGRLAEHGSTMTTRRGEAARIKEQYSESRPRIISDNGPQFI
jgi:hypothetical protein